LEALPERERYAVNLPGRAGTDGPPLLAAADMADFVARWIRSEVEGDYVLVGHSLGGAVAIEHALHAPPELVGVVLLATGARLRVHPMILQSFEQLAESDELPPTPPGLYERQTDPALIDRAVRHRALTPIATARADWHAADGFDRMDDLGRIRAPTLIMSGTDDALTPPKYAEYLAAHIPEAELHILEGAGHMLVLERVAELAARITSWGQAALR
jgi:pimeloyl-ACP methyl ester carboxylesterase